MRASDVPEEVFDDSINQAGITGGDIIWEYGLGKTSGETLPIAPKSRLYVGVTQLFVRSIFDQKQRQPLLADFNGQEVVTKYQRIATDFFAENNIVPSKIRRKSGTIEGKQFSYPSCIGVLDVSETDSTRLANGIEIVGQPFYQVELKMIQNETKLARKQAEILADFRELIEVSKKK